MVGEKLKNIHIDLICTSDLKRTTETVNLAFSKKYPVIIDKRLRELNYGDMNGKPSKEVGWMKKERIKTAFPNGESYEQAMVRIHDFYKELKEKYPDKIILVVGHRATQFGLDTLIDHKTLEECLSIPFKWQTYWEYNWK